MKYTRLEQAILTLNARQLRGVSDSHIADIDSRALLIVTVIYLIALLSVPVVQTDRIIWFALYPIVSAPLAHIAYERLFVNSLYVLPFLILIGIFNPLFDRMEAFRIGNVAISAGWLMFTSILIRGLLSVQALLLLIRITGFNEICEAMHRIGMPTVVVTQLLMVYRYLTVLLQEALSMQRARMARNYGRSSFRVSVWGPFVGQLLLRTIERSRRIYIAMQARGFNGSLSTTGSARWTTADTVYCLIWIPVMLMLRCCDVSNLLLKLL